MRISQDDIPYDVYIKNLLKICANIVHGNLITEKSPYTGLGKEAVPRFCEIFLLLLACHSSLAMHSHNLGTTF